MDVKAEKDIFDILPSYQSESGLVTQDELRLAQQWVKAIAPDERDKLTGDGWLDQWLGTSLPFSFRYNSKGSDLFLMQWHQKRGKPNADPDSEQMEFVWMDETTGLRIVWHIKRFLSYPAVEWVLTFENTGTDDTPIIEDIQALDLRLNNSKPGQSYTVHGVNGGRSYPDDMIPFSWKIPSAEGREIRLGGDHPSSNRHLPFFNLETPEERGVLVGVGWSGNWSARVNVDGTELNARAGLKESHFILHPKELVRTPRILVLFWEGKRLHGHNMLRQLLHKHYVPSLRGKPQEPFVSVNNCFTYHLKGGAPFPLKEGIRVEMSDRDIMPLVEPLSKIGVELFIVDWCWYGSGQPGEEGNWRLNRKSYPQGFRPVSEAFAANNVVFGVWFASECVTPIAPVIKEHPDFVRQKTPESIGTLRMELPEAREWFLKHVDVLVENELMGCYRQDYYGSYGDEPDDRKGITESQHIAGLYTMWDTIIERHPNLIMEGCSGGGRRIDLESLSRFHWHQKSDRWFDSESDQCSLYGANLYLPGGLLILYTEAMDDYGMWSSFAGLLSLDCHPLDDDFPMEQAILQVERYKRIRPLLSGDFYPLTPCSLEEPWIGYQFNRVDLDKGLVLLFKRPASKDIICPVSDTFEFCLRGLNPENYYQVHFERSNRDEVLTGGELAEGIQVVISEEKGAEIITYSKRSDP